MKSEWMKEQVASFPTLKEDIECDICIVGGGLTGLFCAYQLQNEFARVVLIEANTIASGASGRNTGKVSSQHGLNLQNIIKKHGKKTTRLIVEKNQEAITQIKHLIDEYKINCDWESVYSVVGCKSIKQTKKVADEIKVYDEIGIPYELIREDEIEDVRYGAMFHEQGKMNPYAFAVQLAMKLTIQIYEHTPMTRMEEQCLYSGNHKIIFKTCILATQVMPFQMKLFYAVTQPKQSFLAALSPSNHRKGFVYLDEQVTKTWNDMNEYSICGGYDHVLSDDCDALWQKFKRDLVLENPKKKILSTWSSQDYETFDGLPIVGKSGEYYVATGYNKWGNTWSYVASCVIADQLLDKENELIDILAVRRASLVLNEKFLKENMEVGMQFVTSKLKETSATLPQNNKGCIMKINNHPYGIYHEDHKLYLVDAICPHLGCTLKFNEEEKTWDCPCHGSRFLVNGEIMKGPANISLNSFVEVLTDE